MGIGLCMRRAARDVGEGAVAMRRHAVAAHEVLQAPESFVKGGPLRVLRQGRAVSGLGNMGVGAVRHIGLRLSALIGAVLSVV